MDPHTGLVACLVLLLNVNLAAVVVRMMLQDQRATVAYRHDQEIMTGRSSMTRSRALLMR